MPTPNPLIQPTIPPLPAWTDPAMVAAFTAVVDELQTLKRQVEELRQNQVEWITRTQAQQLLGVRETKLWQLTTRDNLIATSGRMVSLSACRQYLADHAVSQDIINARLSATLRAKA